MSAKCQHIMQPFTKSCITLFAIITLTFELWTEHWHSSYSYSCPENVQFNFGFSAHLSFWVEFEILNLESPKLERHPKTASLYGTDGWARAIVRSLSGRQHENSDLCRCKILLRVIVCAAARTAESSASPGSPTAAASHAAAPSNTVSTEADSRMADTGRQTSADDTTSIPSASSWMNTEAAMTVMSSCSGSGPRRRKRGRPPTQSQPPAQRRHQQLITVCTQYLRWKTLILNLQSPN